MQNYETLLNNPNNIFVGNIVYKTVFKHRENASDKVRDTRYKVRVTRYKRHGTERLILCSHVPNTIYFTNNNRASVWLRRMMYKQQGTSDKVQLPSRNFERSQKSPLKKRTGASFRTK